MESKEGSIHGKPPFFKQWKGLYLFILLVELLLILGFIAITNYFST